MFLLRNSIRFILLALLDLVLMQKEKDPFVFSKISLFEKKRSKCGCRNAVLTIKTRHIRNSFVLTNLGNINDFSQND